MLLKVYVYVCVLHFEFYLKLNLNMAYKLRRFCNFRYPIFSIEAKASIDENYVNLFNDYTSFILVLKNLSLFILTIVEC